jgi:hypothetical protein
MTLLNVTSENLVDSGGIITCNHCHSRFPATVTVNEKDNAPIIDDQAQASLITEALQTRQRTSSLPVGWLILSLFLVLLFAGQYIYFKRNELASHSQLRPWLQSFCVALHCELKLMRDISQIRIISREVRSHPSITNALQISLSLRNEAPFRQPWPTLRLTFSDINGQTIAQRSFPPKDYLPAGNSLTDGMPAQISVYTNLVLIDPGKNAVNFAFDFM